MQIHVQDNPDCVRAGFTPLNNNIILLEPEPLDLAPNEGILSNLTIYAKTPFLVSQRNLIHGNKGRKNIAFTLVDTEPYQYHVAISNDGDQPVRCYQGTALCQLKLHSQYDEPLCDYEQFVAAAYA